MSQDPNNSEHQPEAGSNPHCFTRILFFGVVAAGFFVMGAPRPAEAGVAYGWSGTFAEYLGSNTSCGSGWSLWDFVVKDDNTENTVTVNNITIQTYLLSNNTVVGSTSGTSLTGTICVDVWNHGIEITVDGGPNYRNFNLRTYATDPANEQNSRWRGHIHLRRISQGPSVQHGFPVGSAWLNYDPSYNIEVLNIPLVDGATGMDSIDLLVDSSNWFTLVSGGTGMYSISPRGLADGWHWWTFYTGLNGGFPDPLVGGSTYPGWEFFGIDRVNPAVSNVNHSPASPTSSNTVTISGTAQDVLSGLSQIQIFVDGSLRHTCAYGGVTSSQTCISPPQGPYAPGSFHTYSAVARDRAGNQTTASGSFTVQAGPTKVGEARIQRPTGIMILPLFNIGDSGLTGSSLRIQTPAGVRAFDLLPTTHSAASPVRIMTPAGIRAIRKL